MAGPELIADCSRCTGLCCVALSFSRSEQFAHDKAAGEPCRNLMADHRCGIHDRLRPSGYAGCTVFDCFGAGQQVTQVTYGGQPGGRPEDRYAVFHTMRQLHEMLELLGQASVLVPDPEIDELVARIEQVVGGTEVELLAVDPSSVTDATATLLRRTSATVRGGSGEQLARADLLGQDLRGRDLRRADLRGALLVAADLRGADLSLADLVGADLRDTDLRGADLSTALFLTGAQVTAARGDSRTRLPERWERPGHW